MRSGRFAGHARGAWRLGFHQGLRPRGDLAGRRLRLAQPLDEVVGRQFGDPPSAGDALFQMLVDRFGDRVVQLAQAVGNERLVGRMQRGLASHTGSPIVQGQNAVLRPLPSRHQITDPTNYRSDSSPIRAEATIKQRLPHRSACRENQLLIQKFPRFLTQPLQDPGFGLNDGIHAEAQIGGHFGGRQPVDREPLKSLPGRFSEIGPHDRQQFLKHVAIVFGVPFASEIAVRIGQPVQKPFGRIKADNRVAKPLLTVRAHPVDHDLPQPRSERTFAPAFESGNLANEDDQHLLRQVSRFVAQAGNPAEPLADQRQVDHLQATPVRFVRAFAPEPFEQADGRCFHGLAVRIGRRRKGTPS